MKRSRILLVICVLLLLLVQSAQARPTAGYRVDWSNRLSGSGGAASSSGYKVNFTVGQIAAGSAVNPHYKVQWGYWAGTGPGAIQNYSYLPGVKK